VLWGIGEPWKVEDITIDEPGPGEVLLKTKAAGMCHSDEHVVTGDMLMPHYPCIGGHEGAWRGARRRARGHERRSRRPRLDVVHPVVWPLQVVCVGPPEPV
jgi:hypothetical protein